MNWVQVHVTTYSRYATEDLAIWLGKYAGVTLTHVAKVEEYAAHALAKTAHSSASWLGKHLHEMAQTKDRLNRRKQWLLGVH